MANQWFKFYGAEYLSDPKMDRLTVQERSCWLTLLCMASQTDGLVKYVSVEGLLHKSGVKFNPYDSTEWDNAQNVLKTFEQYEMILIHKNGVIEIKNWKKRQEHNLTVAERVAKYRERKRSNKNVTFDVTSVTTEENRIEENRIDKNILFVTFWEKYPPRRKADKAKCEKKFCSFDEQTQKLIVDDVTIRSIEHTDWLKEEGQFVPAPIVYLNKQLWETPIIKSKNNSGKIYG